MVDARDGWDDIAARNGYPRRMWKPDAAFLYYERAEGEEDGTMLAVLPGPEIGKLITVDQDPLLQTFKESIVLDTVYGVHRLLPEGRWCDVQGKPLIGFTFPWQSFPAESAWPLPLRRTDHEWVTGIYALG